MKVVVLTTSPGTSAPLRSRECANSGLEVDVVSPGDAHALKAAGRAARRRTEGRLAVIVADRKAVDVNANAIEQQR